MSSEMRFEFTKDNIDIYLKELAKEYRKQVGKAMPAELIMIGGASVLINYGFRNMTTDIDALIFAASGMKDAIQRVGDKYGLPKDWLNTDFKRTESYSPKLSEFSVYYRTWSNVLTVRTVSAEYLIAMKLRSGRRYKSDLSDVIGILYEHEKRRTPIRMEQIRKAVVDLYGDWDSLPESSQAFVENVFRSGSLEKLYVQATEDEKVTRDSLIQFGQDYPGVTTPENVDMITSNLQRTADRESILAQLRERQQNEVNHNRKDRDSLER